MIMNVTNIKIHDLCNIGKYEENNKFKLYLDRFKPSDMVIDVHMRCV